MRERNRERERVLREWWIENNRERDSNRERERERERETETETECVKESE